MSNDLEYCKEFFERYTWKGNRISLSDYHANIRSFRISEGSDIKYKDNNQNNVWNYGTVQSVTTTSGIYRYNITEGIMPAARGNANRRIVKDVERKNIKYIPITEVLKYTTHADLTLNERIINVFSMTFPEFQKIKGFLDILKTNYYIISTNDQYTDEIVTYILNFFPGLRLYSLRQQIKKCIDDKKYAECFENYLKESLIEFSETFKLYINLYNEKFTEKLKKKLKNEGKLKQVKENEEIKKRIDEIKKRIEETRKHIEEETKIFEEETKKRNDIERINKEIAIKHKFNFDEDKNKCKDLSDNKDKLPSELLMQFLNKYPIYDDSKLDHYDDDILLRYYFKIDDNNIIKTHPYELIKIYIERKKQFIDLFAEVCSTCKINKDVCDIYTRQALKTLKLLYYYYIEIIIKNIPKDEETLSNMFFEYDEIEKLKEKIINKNGLKMLYTTMKQTMDSDNSELKKEYSKILIANLFVAYNYLKSKINE
jgi:hypothetical protein